MSHPNDLISWLFWTAVIENESDYILEGNI